MSDFSRLLLLLELLLIFIKSLDFIYLFQIKEYRLDRFKSKLFEDGFVETFYLRKIKLPAKKLRNYLITSLSLLLIITFYFLSQNLRLISLLFLLVILPIISFVIVGVGVFLTSILVRIYRKQIIDKALQKIKKSNAIFIGITGSYGKSSTKEFLYHILSSKFPVDKTESNMNSDIGVALSIIKYLTPETEIFIAEMGAYRVGEIKSICDNIKPKYGILTGIGNQHVDLFGSKENLITAKSELLKSIPADGKVYLNKDFADYEKFLSFTKSPVCSYSIQKNADIFADETQVSQGTIISHIHYLGKSFPITLNLLGAHNLSNILPCIAIAIDLGISEDLIIQGVARLTPLENKLTINQGINSSTIIKDSNNSNVEGFLSSIETIKNFPQSNKIILSKGIIELGKEKENSYQKIMYELNQTNLTLYTTDNLFKTFDNNNQVYYFQDEEELLNSLMSKINEQTLIVVEGRFTSKFIKSLIK